MDDYESSLLSDPNSATDMSRYSHSNRIFYLCFALVVLVGAGYAYLANRQIGDRKLPQATASQKTTSQPADRQQKAVPSLNIPKTQITPDEKEAALKVVRKVKQEMFDMKKATSSIMPNIYRLNNPDNQLHLRLASDTGDVYQRWVQYFLDSSEPGYVHFAKFYNSDQERAIFKKVYNLFLKDVVKTEDLFLRSDTDGISILYTAGNSLLCSKSRDWLTGHSPLRDYSNKLTALLADAREVQTVPAHGLTARQRMSLDAIRGLYRHYCIAPQGIDSADLPPRPQPFFPLCRPFVEQLIYGNQTGEAKQYDRDAFVRFQNLINVYVTKGYAEQTLGSPLGLYEEAGTPSAKDRDWYRLAVLSHILKEYPSAFLTAEQAVAAKKRFPTAPYLATIRQYDRIDIQQFINLIQHSGPTN